MAKPVKIDYIQAPRIKLDRSDESVHPLLTLAILWKRILPLSGLGSVSPEMTSRSSMSLRPLRKSSSMFSICVPALRRCELTHAVKVWNVEGCGLNSNLGLNGIPTPEITGWNLLSNGYMANFLLVVGNAFALSMLGSQTFIFYSSNALKYMKHVSCYKWKCFKYMYGNWS